MKNLKIILFFSLIIACTMNIRCSEKEKTDNLSGTYDYTGYNADDVVIISGILQLDLSDSANVKGTWQLNQVGEESNTGPQVGAGNLEGGFNNDLLMLDLNPGWADNNVFLIGRFEDNTFSGTWEYSGFAGVINQGNFTAAKE